MLPHSFLQLPPELLIAILRSLHLAAVADGTGGIDGLRHVVRLGCTCRQVRALAKEYVSTLDGVSVGVVPRKAVWPRPLHVRQTIQACRSYLTAAKALAFGPLGQWDRPVFTDLLDILAAGDCRHLDAVDPPFYRIGEDIFELHPRRNKVERLAIKGHWFRKFPWFRPLLRSCEHLKELFIEELDLEGVISGANVDELMSEIARSCSELQVVAITTRDNTTFPAALDCSKLESVKSVKLVSPHDLRPIRELLHVFPNVELAFLDGYANEAEQHLPLPPMPKLKEIWLSVDDGFVPMATQLMQECPNLKSIGVNLLGGSVDDAFPKITRMLRTVRPKPRRLAILLQDIAHNQAYIVEKLADLSAEFLTVAFTCCEPAETPAFIDIRVRLAFKGGRQLQLPLLPSDGE